MKFLRLTHVLRVVMTFTLLAGATLIGSPSASALPYAECNSGWAVMVEVAGGNGGGAYVPAYSSHAGSTRYCWLQQDTSRVRTEVRRLQYGLQYSGMSLYADGVFGGATRRAVIGVQKAHWLTQDGEYGSNTGSVMTWCYWYGGRQSCGRWV